MRAVKPTQNYALNKKYALKSKMRLQPGSTVVVNNLYLLRVMRMSRKHMAKQ